MGRLTFDLVIVRSQPQLGSFSLAITVTNTFHNQSLRTPAAEQEEEEDEEEEDKEEKDEEEEEEE